MGVVHRDLKLENFLLADQTQDAANIKVRLAETECWRETFTAGGHVLGAHHLCAGMWVPLLLSDMQLLSGMHCALHLTVTWQSDCLPCLWDDGNVTRCNPTSSKAATSPAARQQPKQDCQQRYHVQVLHNWLHQAIHAKSCQQCHCWGCCY